MCCQRPDIGLGMIMMIYATGFILKAFVYITLEILTVEFWKETIKFIRDIGPMIKAIRDIGPMIKCIMKDMSDAN